MKMSDDDRRVDPVEIIARVGGVNPDFGGKSRAFEVWIHLANKAGWEVSSIQADTERAETTCGTLAIEGISYRVHYGPRVRRSLIDETGIQVKIRDVLAYAAWAEPIALI
ncbi:hypothetical protein [Streptomyces cylindrosporus]|uniref:Uncharacterized protein n=1 Tax=Streptomyces cylindrosporus TaxID=2927583 RepID=A0ABS9Y5Q7_9ACTN|nr:hypothetical protein [Streptomyces cylindrosporus]MCI3272557.1 hypothetical protein [Streptomyces cylindrosporus]